MPFISTQRTPDGFIHRLKSQNHFVHCAQHYSTAQCLSYQFSMHLTVSSIDSKSQNHFVHCALHYSTAQCFLSQFSVHLRVSSLDSNVRATLYTVHCTTVLPKSFHFNSKWSFHPQTQKVSTHLVISELILEAKGYTVNPLLSPPRGLFISSAFEQGLNREGGLFERGGGGLINSFTPCLPAALKIKN